MGTRERKEREFKKRETLLIDIAFDMFSRLTWDQITISDIAERAEIAKGSIYKHFQSKEEIFARVILRHQRQFREKLLQALSNDSSPVEALRSIIKTVWNCYLENSTLEQRIAERIGLLEKLPPVIRGMLIANQEEINSIYLETIRSGIEQGFFRRVSPEVLTRAVTSIVSGALRIASTLNTASGGAEAMREEITDFILLGLGHHS